MPDGNSVSVSPADLAAHAGPIETIGDGLETARQAGSTVRMDAGAYGKLCTIVPTLLGYLQDMIIEGMADAASSVHDTGARLRAVATGYQSSDSDAADRLNQAGNGLRGGL